LVENLIDLDIKQVAADVKVAFDTFEGELNARVLKPADEAVIGCGRALGKEAINHGQSLGVAP